MTPLSPSPLPRLIALCGKPGSGKTTAAEILRDKLGYTIADDGLPLRQMAMQHLGLTEHQVFTQEGKLETVNLVGQDHTVRSILGEIGNAFEEKFGGDVIPYMTHRSLDPTKTYVMGSVRRIQGHYWGAQGALVIEIDRPDVDPSPYNFDHYDPAAVHVVVLNDGPARGLHHAESILRLKEQLWEAINGPVASALGIHDQNQIEAAE